jgi:hypothetical protein
MSSQKNISPSDLFKYASEGYGPATIAAMIGVTFQTLKRHLAESEELRAALESGEAISAELAESTIMDIIKKPSSTDRDKTAAFSAWARYNRHLTKRQIKSKAEALNELSSPELRAKLNALINRADSPDHATDQTPLQLRLNQSDSPDLPQ